MMLTRKLNVVCCSAPKKPERPIHNARKLFEKKRIATIKENISKLVSIASNDSKEVVDFLKELDELHKKELWGSESESFRKE